MALGICGDHQRMIRHRTLDKLIPNPLPERRAWLPGRRSDRAQLRRYRACEVERSFNGHGAKKEYLIGFWLQSSRLQQKRSWIMPTNLDVSLLFR